MQVEVSDYNGNTVANYYSVVLSNGTSQSLTYDLNGNLVTMTNATTGTAISNVWDAANRLVAIYSNSTYRSVFTYDGLGRRVRQTEISGSSTNSNNWMLWCGNDLCEKRDSTGEYCDRVAFSPRASKSVGQITSSTAITSCSVREMMDGSGNIQACYTYDPWGRRTKLSGTLDADFGFTGHYYHAPSGGPHSLTWDRAYSADLGRWLSRDPLAEPGFQLLHRVKPNVIGDGPNLYEFVHNNPPKPHR